MQNFFVLEHFVCHTPQFTMLAFAFQSEIWIVQNFNFTVFEDFCLSLSWKYRFLQNVNHAKVQSKTNKYCKFHVDLTRGRLSKSRLKKLGMVPKKLYRNTLKLRRINTVQGRTNLQDFSEVMHIKKTPRNGLQARLHSTAATNTDLMGVVFDTLLYTVIFHKIRNSFHNEKYLPNSRKRSFANMHNTNVRIFSLFYATEKEL